MFLDMLGLSCLRDTQWRQLGVQALSSGDRFGLEMWIWESGAGNGNPIHGHT